jgi:hypothetical protein
MRVTRMEKISGKNGSRKMRHLLIMLCIGCVAFAAQGQNNTDTLRGEITFVTSQSVYVKFPSTAGIAPGDTLFIQEGGSMIPALIVKNTSSTSAVTSQITQRIFEKGTQLITQPKKPAPVIQEPPVSIVTPETPSTVQIPMESEEPDEGGEPKPTKPKELIKGRISAAAYLSYADRENANRQRMRYTMTFNMRNIADSRFSFDAYVSFRHTLREWQEVRDNFMQAFKIYSFNVQYASPKGTAVAIGRHINPYMSNIGAMDGIQVDHAWKRFIAGAFAGSRPDYTDYSFNAKLPQFGAYAGHKLETRNGQVQSTIAIAEQRNHGNTDRRFMYVQHTNSALKRINIFTSVEFDLYTMRDSVPVNTFDMTSVYASLRYRVSDKLSLFGSYDARKNIIYYETYKNFIDQLLEDETRQGLRFSFNYRPIKKVTIGSSAGYRFQKDVPRASINLHNYITISQVPGLRTSATLSAIWLQSPYLDGIIYGIRTGRDFLKGKLYSEIEFRMVSYNYTNIENPLDSKIAALQLTYRLTRKLSLSFQYEGEFQTTTKYHRIYTNLIQRF